MQISFLQMLPLVSLLFIFSLGVTVLYKDKYQDINKLFFLISLVFSIWMFGTFMMFFSFSDEAIIFWDRFIYLGVVFMPALQYHYSLKITYSNRIRKYLASIAYILSIFFLLISRTKYFVNEVFRYEWGVHAIAGLFHHFFLIFFFFYIFALLYNFFLQYKNSDNSREKHRLLYLIVSFAILNLIGGIGYLPAYKIAIFSPVSLIAPLMFSVITSYTIIKHRLMNIQFVLRKSAVYLFSLVIVVGLIEFFRIYYASVAESFSLFVDVLILIIAVSLFPHLKNYFYRVSNRYFFTSLYDSQEVISEVSNKLRTTLDIKMIYDFIYDVIVGAFHIKKFSVLKYQDDNDGYVIDYIQNIELMKGRYIINNKELRSVLIDNKVTSVEEMKRMNYNKDTKKVIDLFSQLEIEILMPLKIKDKIIGLIILGKKESGDIYDEEDFRVLEIVCTQAAMAIENAFLYRETVDFNVRLASEVEKATYDLREANKKLLKLDEAKSEFISIASHQLRTPLTVIKGYISMMLEGNFGNLTPQESVSLKKVYESNERLIRLVENLLNISRIESGRLQFMFEEMYLEDLVKSVFDELATHAESKGLKFTLKAPKRKLPMVKIDEEKLRQVIMNLTDNSIKYTNKGSVTVSIKQVKNGIEFCVSDSGIGVSSDDLPNLFKKFSRGTGTSLVHTEGTGLGLYVAKQMIDAHKGKIWAESKGEGKGSRFCFSLPVIK